MKPCEVPSRLFCRGRANALAFAGSMGCASDNFLMQQAMDAQRFNWEMTMTATLRMLLAVALLFGFGQARAQTPSVPISGVDAALIEDIVIGSRLLAEF